MNRPDPNHVELPLFAGIDVGGTNVKLGLVDNAGRIVASTQFPTRQELGPQYAIELTKESFEKLIKPLPYDWTDIAAGGLGTPGPMDIEAGLILTPVNLPGWHQFPVQQAFSETLGFPLAYANDGAAAAYGEFWIGAGQPYDSIVLITLGTGVGGGIIIDDKSIDGAHSHGAEVGHVVIDTGDDARICSCGHMGHLEAYASATGIVARTRERLSAHPDSQLNQQQGEASPLSALMVAQAAAAGDDLACQIVNETAIYLGRGITMLAHVIDPAAFFLGGAVNFGGAESPLGRSFLRQVVEEVKRNSFPVIGEQLKIEFATLGSDAGFVGAAGLGRLAHWQRAQSRTFPTG